MTSWDNYGWLAIFGPVIIFQSTFSVLEVLIWPATKPDIDTDWDQLSALDRQYLDWVSFVAQMGMPSLFFLT